MREAAIIITLIILAIGLRMGRGRIPKKLGAIVFLIAMGYFRFALTGHWGGFIASISLCSLLPLVFIYLNRAKKTYHLKPKPLTCFSEADEAFYPHANNYRMQLEELGFEEFAQNSWQWLESYEHHRFLWHPEYCSVASICLCEREKVAFSFVIFYSIFEDGTSVKTTNYPFSSPLIHPPKSHWNHVPCEEKDITVILKAHQNIIEKHNTTPCSLRLPEPNEVSVKWAEELAEQANYNLAKKLIRTEEEQFCYTPRGYLYLWGQAVKDFIRLC